MISSQVKVGFLVIAAVVAVIAVVVNLGDIQIKKGYEFYILFDDLADLPTRPVVKISGVAVGRVTKIELYRGRARVKVWVEDAVKIHKDTKAKILKMGMIGNTFMSLTTGTREYPLIQADDTIKGENPLSYEEVLDSLVNGLDKVVQVFQKVGEGKDIGANISESFANLKEITNGINAAMGKNGEKLGIAIDNINSSLSKLNDMLDNVDVMLKKEVQGIGVNIRKLGDAAIELKAVFTDIREGKGVAGKLFYSEEYSKKVGDTIDSIYEASKDLKEAVNRYKGFDTSWEAEVYYEPKNEKFRSYSGLTLRSQKRFLNIGFENIVSVDGISKFDSGGDRVNALTVKAGKRFGHWTVFGGAIRSSGGFGAGWLWQDKLQVETELFEFDGEKPWWNISGKLKLTEFLNIGLVCEDILDDASIRTGLEIELE